MNDETKQALVESGLVNAEQLAEALAKSKGGGFIRALKDVTDLSEKDFYDGLSKAYRMPCVSLKETKMAPGARLAVSERCFHQWGIFPIDYDPKGGLMTLAVSGPEHAERIEKIFSFLMESFDNAYVCADSQELRDAIAREVPMPKAEVKHASIGGAKPSVSKPGAKGGSAKMSIPLPSKPREKTEEKGSGKPQASPVPKPAKTEETVSDELVKSLTSAVSLLVNAHLGNDAERIASVNARVRYCKLTATRLAVTPLQATKVILSAWLSALADKKDVIRQFVCPYDLEEIIFAEESGRGLGIESLILSLVRSYQDLVDESPEDARDVNLTRRGLFMKWGPAAKHQDVLETFLQVLMDEQFVDKLGKHAGRIIVLSRSGADVAEITGTMERSGFAVKPVSSVDDVEADAQGNDADLIVVHADGDGKDAVQSCRAIKQKASLSDIGLIALIAEGAAANGAEFLRAGADDFLNDPIDVELFLLKAEKLMAMPARKEEQSGVSGSLADMSFSDLVQVLSAGGKSMDVSVTSGEHEGRIVLRDGNVVHAETGGVTGEQAFYELMLWKVGQFSMSECQSFPEATVTASTMSLLMEGARLADEGAQA